MFSLKTIVSKFNLIPKNNIKLGRWKLKHDKYLCEEYMSNYYGEPGYPNLKKNTWIILEQHSHIVKAQQNKIKQILYR